MAQWHLAPGSFSWQAAAAALAGGPAPGSSGSDTSPRDARRRAAVTADEE
jgi:hypothetical protein